MTPCLCGGEPLKMKKRAHGGGTRLAVKCVECGKRTHWHRPNGGHVHEWERMNGGICR